MNNFRLKHAFNQYFQRAQLAFYAGNNVKALQAMLTPADLATWLDASPTYKVEK